MTIDCEEPLCGLFYTAEEIDENCGDAERDFMSGEYIYSLHRDAFFSQVPGATIEDWDAFVESDRDLTAARESFFERL